MVQENLDLVFTIIWSFALANSIGAALCLFLSPALARLTWIPFVRLAPAVVVTIFFGAFQSSQHFGDIYAMLALGFFGWIMKQLGWPRAPLLVGFVLTKPTEQYLWLSISRYDFEWLLRPGVIVLGLVLIFSIIWVMRGRRTDTNMPLEESGGSTGVLGKTASVIFTAAVLLVVAAALYETLSFPYLGAIFPVAATVPAIFMAAAQIVLDLRAAPEAPAPQGRAKAWLALSYFFSLVLFLLLILFLGFGVATALFTFAFLYGWVGMRSTTALVYTAVVVSLALLMGSLLGLYWPNGMVFELWT